MNRGVIAGIAVLLLGTVIAGFGAYQTYDYQTTVGEAVETEGTVVSTDVRQNGVDEETTEFRAVVRYEYSYDGQQYASETLYPDTQRVFSSREAATTVVSGYEAGQRVTVHVHSDNPSRSFLIAADPPVVNYLLLIGGGVAVLFGTHTVYESVTTRPA